MADSTNDWSLTLASGGKPVYFPSFSSSASIFSKDGRYNIVLLSHQIRVYFISTRQCIKTIDYNSIDVIDFKIDSVDNDQLILFKSTGEITTVNWKQKLDQAIISTNTVNLSMVCIIAMNNNSYYAIVGKSKNLTKSLYKINRSSLKESKLLEIDNVLHFAVSNDTEKLIFVNSNHQILLYNLSMTYSKDDDELKNQDSKDNDNEDEKDSALIQQIEATKEIIPFTYKSSITSIAVANDLTIALGSSLGAIQIYYGGLSSSKPQRLLKWHIDQVQSLQFTPDSSYLLSGGLEKVLVFWHLESDKNQFLPRLNGTISKINIDVNKSDYYTLTLEESNSSNIDDSNFEILIISAVDLISRLSINSIKPKFQNSIKSTFNRTKKKYGKSKDKENFDVSKIKYDYTVNFEIHPVSKNLYFPYNSKIQSYDLIKNEQNFIQNIAPALSTGKVRSETKLTDPIISSIAFTENGEWMCTFDSMETSEIDNLLSKNDTQYALKFWKFITVNDNAPNNNNNITNSINNKTGYWDLSTKIIDPHGNSNPILSIISAPKAYHQGIAFLTTDNKGGLRVWRPRIPKEIYQTTSNNKTNQQQQQPKKSQQTAWTLRKSKPCRALSSDSVNTCWSEDGSIIILGHEYSLTTISTYNFEEIPHNFFKIPSLSGSKITSLNLVDNNLIILSRTRLTSFNLLTGELNDLVAKVNTTNGGKNLIAIDQINKLIILAVNYYNIDKQNINNINSKILIFKPNQLKPIKVLNYNQGISSIKKFNTNFIFIDYDSRIGFINSPSSSQTIEEDNLIDEMNNMLIKAQANTNTINNTSISVNNGKQNQTSTNDEDLDESLQFNKLIDVNSFQPVFENLEGIQINTLFDRIIKVVK